MQRRRGVLLEEKLGDREHMLRVLLGRKAAEIGQDEVLMTKAEVFSITITGDLVRRQFDRIDAVPYDCDPARVDAIFTNQQISEIRRHHDTMIEVSLVGMGESRKSAVLVLSPSP